MSEPKDKWCPFARCCGEDQNGKGGAGSFNRYWPGGEISGGCRCLGTDCALWVALTSSLGHCGMLVKN